jgi:dolichyl-phosphate-mannose--protein O-mannosyl transferase
VGDKKQARRKSIAADRSPPARETTNAARQPHKNVAARFARGEVPPLDYIDALIVCGVTVLACLIYVVNLSQPPQYMYDESYHAFTVSQMVRGYHDAYRWDQKPPPGSPPDARYDWTHPPLHKLLMQISVHAFGDTPMGWRFASVVLGAIGVGMIYLTGRVMFGRMTGALAAALLLLDGLWFVQSRIGMNDVCVATFLMAAYLVFYLYLMRDDRRWLWATGLLLGLALGAKWSALFSLGYLGAVALVVEYRRAAKRPSEAWRSAAILGLALLVVPAAVYLASYAQFFLWGHSFATFVELQGRMWRYHAHLTAGHPAASRWWSWPFILQPVWYAQGRTWDGKIQMINAMGNPATSWVYLPAVAAVAYWWWKGHRQRAALGLILVGFPGVMSF